MSRRYQAEGATAQNSTATKSSLPTSHNGQRHVSGISAKRVPAAMPSSGKPSSSLYIQPQIRQTQLLYSKTSLTTDSLFSFDKTPVNIPPGGVLLAEIAFRG